MEMVMSDNGFVDKAKGEVKENVGKVVGDTKTQSEGMVNKAVGGVKDAVHDVSNAIDSAVDSIKKKFQD
jgi:uncharacterized protein YjbJ (UPF0337 family)